jgi:CRP/FNR family transcriptional regulator, cyclic AMP receptor protein
MPSMPTRVELKSNLKALKRCLERRPMDLDARMRMARTHRLLGERRGAVAHYRAVARYLSLAGQPLQAIAVLKELLQVDPRHEETLLFLAKLYARTAGAEPSAVGRVALPIVDSATGPIALPEGMPPTATGVWHAIRPLGTDVFTVVHEPAADDGGGLSIADELRGLEDTLDVHEDDVLEARPALTLGVDPEEDFEDYEDYEIIGPLTTEDFVLPQVPLFSSLSPDAFVELGHAMVFQRAEPGQLIFREGDVGDSCIVLCRGRARVMRKNDDGDDVELMTLAEGDIAGLFALLSSQNRHASLLAQTHLEYFEIDRLAVDRLVEKHPHAKEQLARLFRERLLLNLLAVLPVFTSLAPAQRQALVERFEDVAFYDEEPLFVADSDEGGLWIVLEGMVRVHGEALGEGAVRLVPGDYLGSFAGSDGAKGGLDATAKGRVLTARLGAADLSAITKEHPDLAGMRAAFERAGLMLGSDVFAGNGRLPGGLVELKPLLEG